MNLASTLHRPSKTNCLVTSFPVTYVTPPFLKKLSASASFNLVGHDRSEDPYETFPTSVHQHLGWCTFDCPLQNQGFLSHQYVRWTRMDPPSLQSKLSSFLASSSSPLSPKQPDLQINAYLSWKHRSSFVSSALAPHWARRFRGCLL